MLAKNRTLAVACFLSILASLTVAQVAVAHAVLLEATPAAGTRVKGPEVAIRLRYNVRIEAGRSRVSLLLPDNSVKALTLGQQAAPDVLALRAAGLVPGEYRIRWQVLASDGHITRGEVPFTVVP